MRKLITAGLLLVVATAAAETAYYRVELVPSGSLVSIGAPVVRGPALLIHGYPDGKLMSVRQSNVRSVSPITAQEAAKSTQKDAVRIADLPMQGGSAPGFSPGSAKGSSPAIRAPGPRIVPVSGGMAITSAPVAPAPLQ